MSDSLNIDFNTTEIVDERSVTAIWVSSLFLLSEILAWYFLEDRI